MVIRGWVMMRWNAISDAYGSPTRSTPFIAIQPFPDDWESVTRPLDRLHVEFVDGVAELGISHQTP